MLKQLRQIRKCVLLLLAVLLAVCVVLGIFAWRKRTVLADGENYLSVSQNDFTVVSAGEQGTSIYYILLEYNGNVESGLPQLETYIYVLNALSLSTDDADMLPVYRVQPVNGSTTQLKLLFAIKTANVGYAAVAPNKLVIPSGTKLGASNYYKTNGANLYAGIVFDGDVTLTKPTTAYEDDNWVCEHTTQAKKVVLTDGENVQYSSVSENQFLLPAPQGIAHKTFLGWQVDGVLHTVGETLDLSSYTQEEISVTAVYLDYALNEGAAIRCAADMQSSGIRFSATLKKSEYDTYKTYILGIGIIIMPSDLIGTDDFVLENYNQSGRAKDYYLPSDAMDFGQDERLNLLASVITVNPKNYTRVFAARAYMLVQFGEQTHYVWDSYIEERSVYEVAFTALETDGENIPEAEKKVLETYVNGVANIRFDGKNATVVSVDGNPLYSCSVTQNDTQITIELDKETAFSGLIYNGNRIAHFSQSVIDGKTVITFTGVAK